MRGSAQAFVLALATAGPAAHCLELMVTLSRLDGIYGFPGAWPSLSARGGQRGWQDGSQSLSDLGEDLWPQLCSQSLEPSALAIWGVSGHEGNCSSEDQEFPSGKADRPRQLLDL